MRVVLFGATGMVGQGVLRECLLDDGVESVLSVGRRAIGREPSKVLEVIRRDLFSALLQIGAASTVRSTPRSWATPSCPRRR